MTPNNLPQKFPNFVLFKTADGKISALEAKTKAEAEHDKSRVIQNKQYISDFDEEVKKLIEKDEGDNNDEI
ncbi:MAG: hypothetical protein WBM02_01470 [bacterium]